MPQRDFVVLSDNWHGLPTSAIHLFRRIARDHRVFWFNTVGRLPSMCTADAGKVMRTFASWVKGKPGPTAESEICVVDPIMIPWFKPAIRRLNHASLARIYRRLRNQHDIERPIVVTTFPYNVDFMRGVEDATTIYYCVDDFLDYPGVNRCDWAVMERELLDNVDGLVVTSRALAHKRTRECPLLHLPHGVELEHFQHAVGRTVPELTKIPGPIVGFFGLISEWVDLALIARLSESFPKVSFVLLGRSEVSLQPLAGRPNVHCLGFIPYAELPRYARHFDVGLIPFVLNQLTRAVNPVKLMEYLALGLPVLSTRLPELENMRGPITLAETPAEFETGLRQILSQTRKQPLPEALDIAQANTWDQRVNDLLSFSESLQTSKNTARLWPLAKANRVACTH